MGETIDEKHVTTNIENKQKQIVKPNIYAETKHHTNEIVIE